MSLISYSEKENWKEKAVTCDKIMSMSKSVDTVAEAKVCKYYIVYILLIYIFL